MGLRFYNINTFEYSLTDYRENNTMMKTEAVLPSFNFVYNANLSSFAPPVLKLYEVQKTELRLKVMNDLNVETLTVITGDDKLYMLKQTTAKRGIYRYIISFAGEDTYWSETFCIEGQNSYEVTKTIKSGSLKIYEADYFEFSRKDYFKNNSTLKACANTYPINFISDVLAVTSNAHLYEISEKTLNDTKTIIENKVDEFSVNINDYNLYMTKQSTNKRGLFRYKILVDGNIKYWSELFCIDNEQTVNDIIKLESGLLKAYNGDFFEFSGKDYLNNNSFLSFDEQRSAFYFKYNTSLISTIEAYVLKLDVESLKAKVINENNIAEIDVVYTNTKVYIKPTTAKSQGIFRYKVVINGSIEIHSDLFCIISPPETISLLRAQFGDGTFIQFSDSGYMEFTI